MNQDTKERYNEGLKYAKTFVYDLCRKYDLEPIEVYAKDFQIKALDWRARLSRDKDGKVYIAYNNFYLICNRNIIEPKLRHEFRHYWQSIYYSKLFLWWMVEHQVLYKSFLNAKDKCGNVLAYRFCPLEIDACAFENDDNGNEEVLKNAIVNVRYWENLLNDHAVKDKH